VLIAQGRTADAAQQVESARQTDPASSLVLSFKANIAALDGDAKSAMTWSNRAVAADSSNYVTRVFRAMLLVRQKQLGEARRLVQNDPQPYGPYTLYVLAATGDSATVRQRLAELQGSASGLAAPHTSRAYGLLGLGDTTRALDALQLATDRREMWPNISPAGLPAFDAVRQSSRFRALQHRVGVAAP
jgi:predicted Zn-dependent protease